eukprot:9374637-Pyramimonas_sp.AAC.1
MVDAAFSFHSPRREFYVDLHEGAGLAGAAHGPSLAVAHDLRAVASVRDRPGLAASPTREPSATRRGTWGNAGVDRCVL